LVCHLLLIAGTGTATSTNTNTNTPTATSTNTNTATANGRSSSGDEVAASLQDILQWIKMFLNIGADRSPP
jgi:hypothetical protein